MRVHLPVVRPAHQGAAHAHPATAQDVHLRLQEDLAHGPVLPGDLSQVGGNSLTVKLRYGFLDEHLKT